MEQVFSYVQISNYYEIIILLNLEEKISKADLGDFLNSRDFDDDPAHDDVLVEIFYEIIDENKKGFSLDWKWNPEDLLWNIEDTVPGFRYKLISNELIYLDKKESSLGHRWHWNIVFTINEQTFSLTKQYEPTKIIEIVNPLLTNEQIVEYNSGGDSYEFIVAPKENSKRLQEIFQRL